MARTLSAAARTSLFSTDGKGEVWLCLLELKGKSDTFNVVNNNEDIVSNGKTYSAYPFEIMLPPDSLEKIPQVTLAIDNVSRLLTDWIRVEADPPSVSLKVILASTPDITEIELAFLKLVSVSWTATTITGTLQVDDIFTAAFPSNGHLYTPEQFPGLF